MFGATTRSAASVYGKVGLETGVSTASPHKLIVMLFDGALAALGKALHDMKSSNVPGKGKAISHAISIIDNGLRASLDKTSGGAIAVSLDSLYEYMSARLLVANINNDPAILDEVQGLLKELRGAWEAIGSDPAVQAQPLEAAPPPPQMRDPLAPQSSRLFKA